MILAVSKMDPTVRAIFLGVAVALFVLSAVGYERRGISFISAGLAAFAFPFFWNALAEV